MCLCILANIIHLFNLTPKWFLCKAFLKFSEVCLIISSALVKEAICAEAVQWTQTFTWSWKKWNKKKKECFWTDRIGSSLPTVFSLQLDPCYSPALSAAFSGLIFSTACTSLAKSQIPAIPRSKATSTNTLTLHPIQQWLPSDLLLYFMNKNGLLLLLMSVWLGSNVCRSVCVCYLCVCICSLVYCWYDTGAVMKWLCKTHAAHVQQLILNPSLKVRSRGIFFFLHLWLNISIWN